MLQQKHLSFFIEVSVYVCVYVYLHMSALLICGATYILILGNFYYRFPLIFEVPAGPSYIIYILLQQVSKFLYKYEKCWEQTLFYPRPTVEMKIKITFEKVCIKIIYTAFILVNVWVFHLAWDSKICNGDILNMLQFC